MRIKMKTLYASPTRSVGVDEVADFPAAEAKTLIEGGYAVPADADPSDGPAATAKRARRRAKESTEPPESDGSTGDAGDGDGEDSGGS